MGESQSQQREDESHVEEKVNPAEKERIQVPRKRLFMPEFVLSLPARLDMVRESGLKSGGEDAKHRRGPVSLGPAVILKAHESEPLFAEILRLTVLGLALLVVFEVDKHPEGDEHQAEDQGDEEPGAGESFEDFLFDDGGEHMGDLP